MFSRKLSQVVASTSSHSRDVRLEVGVGVGVLVLRGERVLLGRRRSGHDTDTWQPPGGHLEFGESVEQCAQREVQEEAAIEIDDMRLGPYTNDLFVADDRHYISLFVIARHVGGQPRAVEPDKTADWDWFEWDSLPEPLFLPLSNLKASGYDPFSAHRP
jgi:8-oxo-dGTP diphosphatase